MPTPSTTCSCGSATCRTTEIAGARRGGRSFARAVAGARAGAAHRARAGRRRAPRVIAVEDAARYRDALGAPLPQGIARGAPPAGARSARRSRAPLRAHARTVHDRRSARDAFGIGQAMAEEALARIRGHRPRARRASSAPAARIASGAKPACCARSASVRSRGCGAKWSRSRAEALGRLDDDVARCRAAAIRARRAARRHRAAPGSAAAGLGARDRSPPSARGRLSARATSICSWAPGEVAWVGVEPLGDRDGRIALYLTDHLRALVPPRSPEPPGRVSPHASSPISRREGASFFPAIHAACGGGFPDRRWSTRCGTSSGPGWSPTTRCTRCAPSSPRLPRTRRDRQTRRSARGAPRRPRRQGDGRSSSERDRRAARAHRVGDGHRPAAAQRATASSRARRWPPKGMPRRLLDRL